MLKTKHMASGSEFPDPVMGGTLFATHETRFRNRLRSVLHAGRAHGLSHKIVLVEGHQEKKRDLSWLERMAGKRHKEESSFARLARKAYERGEHRHGESHGTVSFFAGIGEDRSELHRSPLALLLSQVSGSSIPNGPVYSVGFNDQRRAVQTGSLDKVIRIRAYGDEHGHIRAKSFHYMMAAAIVPGHQTAQDGPLHFGIHHEREFSEKTFADISRAVAGKIQNEDKGASLDGRAGMAVIFGRFRELFVATGSAARSRTAGRELLVPSPDEAVPAVIISSFTFEFGPRSSVSILPVTRSVVIVQHKGAMYGGDLRGAISADPTNHGFILLPGRRA